MRSGIVGAALLALGLALFVGGCHHSKGGGGDMAGVSGDGGSSCLPGGETCAAAGDCCSNTCDATTHICGAAVCKASGAACATPGDCCNLNCDNHVCGTAACVSDGKACSASGASCCSGPSACQSGTCAQLGSGCHTAGNACIADGDCCGGHCDPTSKTCATPSAISYCTQVGDVCYKDADCCTSVCQIGATGAGTCKPIPNGTCDVDGTVCTACNSTNTSTVGKCCSTYCGPYGTDGSTVCQPAGGCRIQGDLCTQDGDCCGGATITSMNMCVLPGDGAVKCNIFDTTRHLGTCGAPSTSICDSGTCIPEGDVCHCQLVDSKGICWDSCPSGETCKPLPSGCSVSGVAANCCGTPGANKMTCRIDAVGVPRCYTVSACVNPGGSCATSADCCSGNTCIPDGTGKLVCGSTSCVPSGGQCTATSDCCGGTGDVCVFTPGHNAGVCANPTPPPADGGTTADMAAPSCSLAGQQCSTSQPCCAGSSCTNTTTGVACSTSSGCVCTIAIQ